MAVLIFLGCLLGGIAIGLPIARALLLCGAALMFWLEMFDVQIMAQTLVNGADSFSLLAIPFFVLAGEIMNAGGLSKRIVDLPMKLVGHKPGGLGYVGVLAAMIMASLSGSAVADTAAVAALLVPMMRSANYPVNRAAGLIASGGIIAPIIPLPFRLLFSAFPADYPSVSCLWRALPPHDDGRNADAYSGGRPVALIYPASKSNDAGNLALFCLRYLGAVSSSHHYWRVSLRSVYPYRSRGRCCFLCAVCRHSYLP